MTSCLSATLFAALSAAPSRAAAAEASLAGRWQGQAEIPGTPLPIVVDLAPASKGPPDSWVGSVILPGRGVKGAPLAALRVSGDTVTFTLAQALPPFPGPSLEVRLARDADGRLAGELREGALAAPMMLVRSGDAQVDRPVEATALAADLLGRWVGRYELGGAPREVSLTLANSGPGGVGGGELVIVGKRRNELAIDHVVQARAFVTLAVRSAGLRIEGRADSGTIEGRVVQGPFEAPLVLRRPQEAR